jgi:diphosphomevalonate decarboxylase
MLHRRGGCRLPRRKIPGAATYEASPNIALVKYWGLRDPARMLPFNSSVSVTLSGFRTRTSVEFDPELTADELRLNGRLAAGGPLESASRFLERVRQRAHVEGFARIETRNNFPTASGLASSASGFAALAGAASRAAGLAETPAALSELARFGSGSACRSVYGGYVEWQAGHRADGGDCYAKPLFPPQHWPELVDLVAIVRDAPEKAVRSQESMQHSVETSPEYRARQRALPRRIGLLRRALRLREARALFRLVMEECDEFRHVCETTDPPLDYLTPTSREVIAAVEELNRGADGPVAGYTHDAGAHLHLFVLRRDLRRLREALRPVPGVARSYLTGAGPGGRFLGRRRA